MREESEREREKEREREGKREKERERDWFVAGLHSRQVGNELGETFGCMER